jgi:serine/threonine-protein kinase
MYERMAREARAAAGVSHPNLVTMFDTGVDKAGPYLVMELVAGPTLAAPGRDIPPEEAIRIGAQLADALATVHAAGVVHRDVKPANVILAQDGPRLTDFGIASMEEATSELTMPGTVMGTPSYAAPEVLAGKTPTPASDVFSLAALIYGVVSRGAPFAGANRAEPPPPLDDLAIDRALRPALASNPSLRPSARELAASLRASAPTTAVPAAHTTLPMAVAAQPTQPMEPVESPTGMANGSTKDSEAEEPRRTPLLLWLGIGLAVVLAGLLLVPALLADDPTATPPVVTTAGVAPPATDSLTTLPPTTVVDPLTEATDHLAAVLAAVGPPELKPKEEGEILRKVEEAINSAVDKPAEAAKSLRDAANVIGKELSGSPEQDALAALGEIAEALGLDLNAGEDDG